jgi:hypothetical protein
MEAVQSIPADQERKHIFLDFNMMPQGLRIQFYEEKFQAFINPAETFLG